jgi:hypothetical protein
MSKQTSVEWFVSELLNGKPLIPSLIEQAKEMEEKQILDFTRKAVRKILDEDRQNPFNLEEFYNETYGK